VWLFAEVAGVPDSDIPIEIYEVDPFDPDEFVISGTLGVTGGFGWATWTAFWMEDGLLGLGGDPEYKFVVMGIDSPELTVKKAVLPTPTPTPTATPTVTPTPTPTPAPTSTPTPSTLSFSHPASFLIDAGDTLNLTNVYVISSVPEEPITGRIDWDEGDGYAIHVVIAATGQYVGSHTYTTSGTYTLTLRANSDSGSVGESTIIVVVAIP
jgi:hypothetical protein